MYDRDTVSLSLSLYPLTTAVELPGLRMNAHGKTKICQGDHVKQFVQEVATPQSQLVMYTPTMPLNMIRKTQSHSPMIRYDPIHMWNDRERLPCVYAET